MPHAYLVAQFEDVYGIDGPNHDNLIDFVNKHFIAEMPHFEGEDCQNMFALHGIPELTDVCKQNAVEMVRMNNTHKCATAIHGCRKEADDECRRGYSCADTILETFVMSRQQTNRIIYRQRMKCDMKTVPFYR